MRFFNEYFYGFFIIYNQNSTDFYMKKGNKENK